MCVVIILVCVTVLLCVVCGQTLANQTGYEEVVYGVHCTVSETVSVYCTKADLRVLELVLLCLLGVSLNNSVLVEFVYFLFEKLILKNLFFCEVPLCND